MNRQFFHLRWTGHIIETTEFNSEKCRKSSNSLYFHRRSIVAASFIIEAVFSATWFTTESTCVKSWKWYFIPSSTERKFNVAMMIQYRGWCKTKPQYGMKLKENPARASQTQKLYCFTFRCFPWIFHRRFLLVPPSSFSSSAASPYGFWPKNASHTRCLFSFVFYLFLCHLCVTFCNMPSNATFCFPDKCYLLSAH